MYGTLKPIFRRILASVLSILMVFCNIPMNELASTSFLNSVEAVETITESEEDTLEETQEEDTLEEETQEEDTLEEETQEEDTLEEETQEEDTSEQETEDSTTEEDIIPEGNLPEDLILDTNDTLTRAQWLHNLAIVFDMTVEDEEYPDNYFSDLKSTDEYYYDILLNVNFGVVDVEAGGEVCPDDALTREFAAQTLNYCLGFQLEDENYTFSDVAEFTYLVDAQVAINRGWFALIDGKFCPENTVTDNENKTMLEDAIAVFYADVVDENYENKYEFDDSIIEIPNGTQVSSKNGIVTITDCPVTLNPGDKFAVYFGGIPQVYEVSSVSVADTITTVQTTTFDGKDLITSVDAQGVVDPDSFELVVADGTELEITEVEKKVTTYGLRPYSMFALDKVYNLSTQIDLGGGESFTCTVEMKNPIIEYNVTSKPIGAYVTFETDAEISFSAEIDTVKEKLDGELKEKYPNGIELLFVGVPEIGGFDVCLDLSLAGSLSGCNTVHIKSGISYSFENGFRLVKDFKSSNFSIVAKATARVGLEVKLGVTQMPILKGYVYAKVGTEVSFTMKVHEEGQCSEFSAHLYGAVGAVTSIEAGIFSTSFDRTLEIWNDSCSPMRIKKHYDNGKEVMRCAWEDEETTSKKFYTPSTSKNASSGWGEGFSSTGYDEDGEEQTIYTYELDSLDHLTITGYHGNASVLYIPERIDGYVVVGIGEYDYVFQNNHKLTKVVIPNTITEIPIRTFENCSNLKEVVLSNNLKSIGYSAFRNSGLESIDIPDSVTLIDQLAFYQCENLSQVKLSKRLEHIDGYAFAECDSLRNIEIPKKVKTERFVIIGYGDTMPSYYGIFVGCDNLKHISFEEGRTEIPEGMFAYNDSIEEIVLPDTITTIENRAFLNCTGLQAIKLPAHLEIIDEYAFSGCSSLEEIELPDSVTDMDVGIFSDCTSLINVKLPKERINIPMYTFQNCVSLERITLPEYVSCIRENAFANCSSLKEIVWNTELSEIGAYAFQNCNALTSLEIPDTVQIINEGAFYNCDGLVSIKVPNSVTSIGSMIFYDNDALKSIDFNCFAITEQTFYHCDSLEEIELLYGIEEIGKNAFQDSLNFKKIIIPRTTTLIEETAFSHADKLTIHGVPGTYAEEFALNNDVKFVDREVHATSVSLKETDITLQVDKSYTLYEVIAPRNFTDEIVWESDNDEIVTVDAYGNIQAINPGTAFVTVRVGEQQAVCQVYAEQMIESIELDTTDLDLEAFQTYQLEAEILPEAATNKKLKWTSANPEIAMVDEHGFVTAKKKGQTIITAEALDGSGVYEECVVTVLNNRVIAKEIRQLESLHDYENDCTDYWQYTLEHAEHLEVTFHEKTELEEGYDYLHIYDEKGNIVGSYSGSELAGKTILVPGNTIIVQLETDDEKTAWGFQITDVKAYEEKHSHSYSTTYTVDKKASFFTNGSMSKHCKSSECNSKTSVKTIAKIASVKLAMSTYTYTGKLITPTVVVKDSIGQVLKKNTDYTIKYASGRKNPGQYQVVITFKGKYSGNKTLSFKIVPKAPSKVKASQTTHEITLSWAKVTGATGYDIYSYNTQNKRYTKLKSTTDTKITIKGRQSGTKYNYVVCAYTKVGSTLLKSDYSAVLKTATKPGTPTIRASAGTKSATLTWNKVSGATGYVLYMASSKNGTYKRIATVNASKLKYTKSNLTKGKTYYFKMKAYTSNGVTVYGANSSIKSVKIK